MYLISFAIFFMVLKTINGSCPPSPGVNTGHRYFLTVQENFDPGDPLTLCPVPTVPGGGTQQYDIIDGNIDGQFKIDTFSGVLKVRKRLDRETRDKYDLKLKVNTSSSSITVLVQVTITDVNDNDPTCPTPRNVTVTQIAPPGQVVLALRCTDEDEGDNAESDFSISSTGYLPFSVSQYGNILVSTPLVFRRGSTASTGDPNTFNLKVNVQNKNNAFMRTSVNVTISVTKSGCPAGWTFNTSPGQYLSAPVLSSISTSKENCQHQCQQETQFSCNSVNWRAGTCQLLTETESTMPGELSHRDSSTLMTKHCIAEPEPSPFIEEFLLVMPSGSDPIHPILSYALLRVLEDYATTPDDQTHTDCWEMVRILHTLSERTNMTAASLNVTQRIVKSMAKSISGLLQDMYVQHWHKLRERGNKSSSLLTSMERMTSSLAAKMTSDLTLTTDKVAVVGVRVKAGKHPGQSLELTPGQGHPSSVSLPYSDLTGGTQTVSVVVCVFEDMDRITDVTQSPAHKTANERREDILRGDVVSVVVHPPPLSALPSPVILDIESAPEDDMDVLSRKCVFLDNTNTTDTWRGQGCNMTSTNATHTRCQCNHLTNFAVLMQIVHVEMTAGVELSLEILTYIGCALSISALSATIFVNLWLKMNTERVVLLINLSVSLILAQLVFMAGAGATQNTSTCRVIAALLHYLYLTVFSQMLVEGLQLYMRLYLAFNKDGKVVLFVLAGWCFPLVLVGISVGVDTEGYGTEYSCWLSTERGTIWAFVGPALIIGAVNLLVLGLVIRTFLSLRINARKTDRQKFLSSLKAMSVLLPLLGTTWTFGVLAINTNTVAFQYLFALLNSTQGVFIFLFHVVCNDEVKLAYWKKRGRILTVNSAVTNSNSTALTTTHLARRKAFGGFMTSTHM